MKLYVDTCVYLSFFLNEPKFENKSWRFFELALQNSHTILYSKHVLFEIDKNYLLEKTSFFFSHLEKNMAIIDLCSKDEETAKLLNKDNYDDALHYVLAQKENADYIVTWNYLDFMELKNTAPQKIKVVKPTHFI